MKKVLMIGMVAMMVTMMFSSLIADARGKSQRNWRQEEARHILKRSALIVQEAQNEANDHTVYQGTHHGRDIVKNQYHGLGRAVSHQIRANKLYRQGNYLRASYHALRARAIAGYLLDLYDNRVHPRDDYNGNYNDHENLYEHSIFNTEIDEDQLDDIEIDYWRHCPSEEGLAKDFRSSEISDDRALTYHVLLYY